MLDRPLLLVRDLKSQIGVVTLERVAFNRKQTLNRPCEPEFAMNNPFA